MTRANTMTEFLRSARYRSTSSIPPKHFKLHYEIL